MTAIILAVICVALTGALLVQTRAHQRERRALIDRVIARHTGEVLALDSHERRPRKNKKQAEPVEIVGI